MANEFGELSKEEKQADKRAFGKKIGILIKDARIAKGMTQDEVADKAGLYRTYVGFIEKGAYSPSVYTVQKIAKALDTKLSSLLKDL
ncbi:MAG: helix-turn-helix transcriptional regulator [bacterium]